MWTVLQLRLLSLNTATKLVLGFGIVLALTLAVAATGFTALRAVGERTERMEEMRAINSDVLVIRHTEKDYALSADAKLAEQLRQQAEAIVARSEALAAQLTGPGRDALGEVSQAMTEYRGAFDRYVELTDNQRLALEAANWLVVSASNSLDVLQSGLNEDGVDLLKDSQGAQGAELVTQGGQIGRVYQLLLQALNQARLRLEQSRGRTEAGAPQIQEALDAQKLAAELRDAMQDPGYAAVLTEVIGNVDSFNERLNEYTSILERQRQEYAHLAAQADRVARAVERAYELQKVDMRAQQHSSSLLILLAAALALLIGLAATAVISLLIVRPLRGVIALARQVADGDLSASIEVRRRDEIGQLMEAMQDMSGNLRGMVGRLQGGVTQISASAQALSGITEQTRVGVNGQKEETDQVATAMSQMAATVQEVARNAEAAAGSTEAADNRVSTGSQVVRQTLERVNQLARAMEESTTSIQRLSQDTQSIGSVLDVIKNVAEQTNLLALNAAIEAARAGEQGRGFAVVADEVRALARRTQQSTAEIERLIATLREGVRSSVEHMQLSGSLVDLTVQDANRTEEALAGIAEAVTLIHQMNQQIAAAAEQQSAVAEEINRSVTSIRDIADQSAVAMDETASSSVQLARLGQELQGLAGHFRL